MNYAVLTKKMRFFRDKHPVWQTEGTVVKWRDEPSATVHMTAPDEATLPLYVVAFAIGARDLSPLEVLAHSEMTEGLD